MADTLLSTLLDAADLAWTGAVYRLSAARRSQVDTATTDNATHTTAIALLTSEMNGVLPAETAFTNADLSSGVLSVTHNKNRRGPPLSIIDNTGAVVRPDSVTFPTVNTASVDLTSFGAITGTWYACVQ